MGNVPSTRRYTEGSGTFLLEDVWIWDSRAGMKMNWNVSHSLLCGTSKLKTQTTSLLQSPRSNLKPHNSFQHQDLIIELVWTFPDF